MAKQYLRLEDGLTYEAVQYGKPEHYDPRGIVDIASFLLGIDVEAQVAVNNERMLDVVNPIQSRWNPRGGVADVFVTDPNSGFRTIISLGDWVLKSVTGFFFVKSEDFSGQYKEVTPPPPVTEFDELSDIIYNSFSSLEGELYQALAESAAAAVIRAGWSRREKP